MAMDTNEDYYYGDFGEQINRSDAIDDGDDMMDDGKKKTDDATVPMPSSDDAENAFQERLSTERTDRDDSSTEDMPKTDYTDELEGRDIRE